MNFLNKIKNKLSKKIAKWYWNYRTQQILAYIFLFRITIDDLDNKNEKVERIPSTKLATPEITSMPHLSVHFKAKSLPKNVSLAESYTVNLNQVIYCPKEEVLLTQSRKLIIESASALNMVPPDHIFRGMVDESPITDICTVIRSTRMHRNYGHCLVDCLPRLYLLNQPEYQDIDEIKLLFSTEPTPIEKFVIEKLAPKNIKIKIVENRKKLYLVDRLIFPSFLNCPSDFSSDLPKPSLYNFLFTPNWRYQLCGALPNIYLDYFHERILPQRQRKKINRIFISRAKVSSRNIINEDELFDKLKKYGFQKYFPEELSIEEQINLFYDADYVVGTTGAALTNIIYSSQIKVLELYPIQQFVDPFFYFLSKSLGHTHKYWSGQGNPNRKEKNFRVNVSEIVTLIESNI